MSSRGVRIDSPRQRKPSIHLIVTAKSQQENRFFTFMLDEAE
jgi:hypothetical protein